MIDSSIKAKKIDPIMNKDGEIVGYRANIPASTRVLKLLGKEMGMFMGRKEPEQFEPYDHIEELE